MIKNILCKRFAVWLLFLCFLGSCANQIKFDKNKWQPNGETEQPPYYRREMLNDLLTNYKLVGKQYANIISLLGIPSFKDSCNFGYNVIVDYGSDIDPIYTKTLDFVFSKDSIIISCKVNEWRKNNRL